MIEVQKICKVLFKEFCIAPPKPEQRISETSGAGLGVIRAEIDKSPRDLNKSRSTEKIKTGTRKRV